MPGWQEVLSSFRWYEILMMTLFLVVGGLLVVNRAFRHLPAPLLPENGKEKIFGFRVGEVIPYSSRKHRRAQATILGFCQGGRRARLHVHVHPHGVTVRRSLRRLSIEAGRLIAS